MLASELWLDTSPVLKEEPVHYPHNRHSSVERESHKMNEEEKSVIMVKDVSLPRSEVKIDGLLNINAIIMLIMWYIFSFLTLFMNKYTLSTLGAEAIFFCKSTEMKIWFLNVDELSRKCSFCAIDLMIFTDGMLFQ